MLQTRQLIFALFVLLGCFGCRVDHARPYDFPRPVNTETLPIERQEKVYYRSDDGAILIDNDFPGARISDLSWGADGKSATLVIRPENEPINPSPWYAFRIASDGKETIELTLDYEDAYHRYFPKLSTDGENWVPMDSSRFQLGPDTTSITITLDLQAGAKLWVAGQELWPSRRIEEWVDGLVSAAPGTVRKSSIGKSRLGKDLLFLDIYKGEARKKPAIVLFGRQHPPEVTGFLALMAFMDELLNSELSPAFLSRYRILLYPLLNPDGVDLGHWRHNAGGIDLNRDWAYYRQPEVKAVADHVASTLSEGKNKLQLGMDFHSTWKDVYYTPDESVELKVRPDFRQRWHAEIEKMVGNGFRVNNDPSPIDRPTAAGWFSTQFGVPGITYEVGDSTPRDFIETKARASATAMMKILLQE